MSLEVIIKLVRWVGSSDCLLVLSLQRNEKSENSLWRTGTWRWWRPHEIQWQCWERLARARASDNAHHANAQWWSITWGASPITTYCLAAVSHLFSLMAHHSPFADKMIYFYGTMGNKWSQIFLLCINHRSESFMRGCIQPSLHVFTKLCCFAVYFLCINYRILEWLMVGQFAPVSAFRENI